MSMSQDPKKHHFVPVFYLRAWAGADRQLVRLHRPYSPVVWDRKFPDAIGYEPHLYAFEGVPLEFRQTLEKEFFHPVDTKAAETHRLLLAGQLNALTNDQRVHWARFMLSMQGRSPFGLLELKRMVEHIMLANMGIKNDADYLAARKPGAPETMYEWLQQHQPQVIENAHKQFLPGLIDHEDLGQHLINMDWSTIGLHAASNSLLTSDRPLVSTHGWKDPNAVLLFPLSKRCLQVLTNSQARTAQVHSEAVSVLVPKVNDMLVRYAVDSVFADGPSHQTFVERRLRKRDEEPIPGPIGKGRPGCPA
jgi:hypothetical protein